MTRGGTVVADRITLRPHHHLFRQGVVAVLAFMTPVFVVLYVMTVPDGPWEAVLVTQVLATVAVAGASVAYFRVAIWVDRTSITETGFFGRTVRVEADQIGSIFLAEVFEPSGTHTVPQLFVRDATGRQVLRMRGQFWSRESMETVLSTLEVPKEARDHSLSTQEIRDEYPGLLYWFERRPALAAVAVAAGAALLAGVVYVLFRVVGLN